MCSGLVRNHTTINLHVLRWRWTGVDVQGCPEVDVQVGVDRGGRPGLSRGGHPERVDKGGRPGLSRDEA